MPKQTPLPFPDAAAADPHATDAAGARAPTDPIDPTVADADPASSSDTPSAMPEPTPPNPASHRQRGSPAQSASS